MNFEEKINELKIVLPEAKAPVGSYVSSKIIGKMLFISGFKTVVSYKSTLVFTFISGLVMGSFMLYLSAS